MALPNFIIVGAAKAGTTSLYYYLGQHPDVFMSAEKEPHFFAPAKWCSHPVPTRAQYEALFEGSAAFKAVGEASTGYLYYPDSPRRIHALIPRCRIVALLRNPVDRAFSGWCHEVREGVEKVSFEQALAEERAAVRVIRGSEFSFNYVKQGFVARLLREYLDLFGRERVHICFFDDLTTRPVAVMRGLFRFLEVDETAGGDWSYPYNPSGVPRIRWLHDLLDGEVSWRRPIARLAARAIPGRVWRPLWNRLRDWNLEAGTLRLDPATRAELVRAFAGEVAELERITGRDLAAWKS